ncbi:radical SAM protein [Methanomicrobium antiquum]|uniref:Radical SAM protein n=1 Tax=Methanomicrobium antiquum TaxID=487686 RepID=A0AAF0FS76_9EURY|nr:radical SAM protein [Methanomicrobium antiquum]WFN37622.1 radical SAM protein [Methanomicrobium antiquum]
MHFIKAKSLLSKKNGMNVFRGCTHGCIYCDSRSDCYNMGHDFSDVAVKINAPALLEKELRSRRKRCMIGTGSMCDPYIPEESELKITRRCLEIIEKFDFGLSILTKSDRILRDLDLLIKINENSKCVVQVTLTTSDNDLCKILEPGVCTTQKRFELLDTLKENNIPTVVWLCPILPYINDTEENIRGLLGLCKEAEVYGVLFFGAGLTLRPGSREYFYEKLDEHFPGLKEIYQINYGNSYEILSPHNSRLAKILHDVCKKESIVCDRDAVFSYLNTYEDKRQKSLVGYF